MSEISKRNLDIVSERVNYNWNIGMPHYSALGKKYGISACRASQIFNKTTSQLLKHYKLCVVFHKEREAIRLAFKPGPKVR